MTYQTLRQSILSLSPRLGLQPPRGIYIDLSEEKSCGLEAHWKRAVDIVVSLISILLLSPLMLVVALLIKLTSPGPVLFRQERVGVNRRARERRAGGLGYGGNQRRVRERRIVFSYGKPFSIYKFRTMVDSAESSGPCWASEDDPRITPLGRVLRKSRIDEIPQFFNVLKGDMSIVGPRPERAFFIIRAEKEIPEFKLRLKAKPGITGLAQVELGYTNDTAGMRKKLRFDLDYIRSMSLWTDLKIMVRTISVVITGKGAC